MNRFIFALLSIIPLFGYSDCCCSNGQIEWIAEYLCWRGEVKDQEFLTKSTDLITFPGIVSGSQKTYEPQNRWKSGFRVGIGYVFCDDSLFHPEFIYTYYRTKGKRFVSTSLNPLGIYEGIPSLPPAIPPASLTGVFPLDTVTAAYGASRVHFSLNDFDLNFISWNQECGCWQFGIDFGFKGSLLKNSWRTHYGLLTTLGIAIEGVNIRWKYQGLGPKIKFSGSYDIGWGFNLYQDFSGAILIGKLRTKTEAGLLTSDGDEIGISNNSHGRYKGVPFFQSETGLAWIYDFDCGSRFEAKVAFEYLTWINVGQHKFYTVPQAAPFKNNIVDATVYGLTTGIAFVY